MGSLVKADLLTYPLPDWNFGLEEICRAAHKKGINLVGIISYIDRPSKNPYFDDRFERIFGHEGPFGFSQDEKIIFVRGFNGPTEYNGESVRILRIGKKYPCTFRQNTEEALEEAEKQGVITLVDSRDREKLEGLIGLVDGTFWASEFLYPSVRKLQRELLKNSTNESKPVAVSNAHTLYWGHVLSTMFRNLGAAHSTFYLETFEDTIKNSDFSGTKLTKEIKEGIKAGRFISRYIYASILEVFLAKLFLTARKKTGKDYKWKKHKGLILPK